MPHTQEPWTLGEPIDVFDVFSIRGPQNPDGTAPLIAGIKLVHDADTVAGQEKAQEETRANASLIKAAPNLLLALENIINAVNANPHPIHYVVKDAIQCARDVVEEAKGEA